MVGGRSRDKRTGEKRSREGIVNLGPDINKVKGRRKEEDRLKREVDQRRVGQLFKLSERRQREERESVRKLKSEGGI